jgi:hypothetical protein
MLCTQDKVLSRQKLTPRSRCPNPLSSLQAQEEDKKQSSTHQGHNTQQSQTHEKDEERGINSPSDPADKSTEVTAVCRHNKKIRQGKSMATD